MENKKKKKECRHALSTTLFNLITENEEDKPENHWFSKGQWLDEWQTNRNKNKNKSTGKK